MCQQPCLYLLALGNGMPAVSFPPALHIVLAALTIVDRQGGTEGVTLRSVAREVGIAAPTIYPGFPDAETILRAVVGRSAA